MDASASQREICRRIGAAFVPPAAGSKLGIARAVGAVHLPLNGLRHPVEGETCGWYVWAGEALFDAPDFFQPMHIEHVSSRCHEILPYLGLAPGWRFLIADGYEDMWYDSSLLELPA
jgi:hypothetical protein